MGGYIHVLRNKLEDLRRKKEQDHSDFFVPLGDFAHGLSSLCYMYTPSGYFLHGDGIRQYATKVFYRNMFPFWGKNPGQMRTHVVNLLGADIDPKTETNKDDYNAALELLLYHIINSPKYTVVPDYYYSNEGKSIKETEKWFHDAAEVTGASSAVNALFKGVPFEDLVFEYIPMRFRYFGMPWQPDWADNETQKKFVHGINALRDDGKFWNGTNIEF